MSTDKENENTPKINGFKLNSGWMAFGLLIIVYTVVVSGFVFTNNTKTIRNEKDIRYVIEEIKDIRKDQKEFAEKLYLELKELNRAKP